MKAPISGKVNILVCQKYAEDVYLEGKCVTFDLCGPTGKVECEWIDPYFGLFKVKGEKGSLMVRDFQYLEGVWCENLEVKER